MWILLVFVRHSTYPISQTNTNLLANSLFHQELIQQIAQIPTKVSIQPVS